MARSAATARTAPKGHRRRLGGMSVETQATVVALLGGLLISITLSGRFTSYVRPDFKWLLLVAGAILVAVGLITLGLAIRSDVRASRAAKLAAAGGAPGPDEHDHGDPHDAGDDDDGDDAHGHDHSRSNAPWLILAPVLVLLLVAPPALGADAVARNATSQGLAGYDVTVAAAGSGASTDGSAGGGGSAGADGLSRDGTGAVIDGGYAFNDGSGSVSDSSGSRRTMHFPPLEGTDPQIGLKDFILRALYDADNSVAGVPVTVVGFVAPSGEGYDGGYTIARMVISCCAADANPMRLHVDGDAPFPSDTWVQAVVTVVPNTATLDNGYVPTVTVSGAQAIDQPDDPYEH